MTRYCFIFLACLLFSGCGDVTWFPESTSSNSSTTNDNINNPTVSTATVTGPAVATATVTANSLTASNLTLRKISNDGSKVTYKAIMKVTNNGSVTQGAGLFVFFEAQNSTGVFLPVNQTLSISYQNAIPIPDITAGAFQNISSSSSNPTEAAVADIPNTKTIIWKLTGIGP